MSLLGKYLASLEEVEEYDVHEKSYTEPGHDIMLGPSCDPLEDIIEENEDVLDAYDRIDDNDVMDDNDWVDADDWVEAGKIAHFLCFSLACETIVVLVLFFSIS